MTEAREAPASYGQASLWFLRQVMPYPSAYSTALELRLEGELDAHALEVAFAEVVRRHESFRTTFRLVDGEVVQVIHPALSLDFAIVDEAPRVIAARPFDLEKGPLLRVRLIRHAPTEHSLVVVMDHIIADGMSLGILWREVSALYRGAPLEPPPRQFAECVAAQNAWLATPGFTKQLKWWTDRLRGATSPELPEDRARPAIRTFKGDLVRIELGGDLTQKLRAMAAKGDVSLFALLLAGLDVLLARYSGQSDVVVMIPIACRSRFGAEDVVGFFANMVTLRTEVEDALAFGALAKRVNTEIMGSVFRQDVPFEKVIEALRPDRSASHDPLARIALSFLPRGASVLDLPGVRVAYDEVSNGGAKFDLHLVVTEHPGHLTCSAEFNTDVFDPETMLALLEHFRLLLGAAAEAPETTCAELPLLSAEERHRLVTEWNDTRAHVPSPTFCDLFAAAVVRAPNATAVDSLAYVELDRRSNQVARALLARGAGPGVLVGVAVERSAAMVVALLGILKAGSAYVPLDPAYPRARLALMAEDAKLHLLVTERDVEDLIDVPNKLLLDRDAVEIAALSDQALDVIVEPESTAYVIYTSGSTGRPKGVVVPHRALANFLTSMASRPGLGPSDRLLAVTSLSFDIAGLELWLPLSVGAEVVIASRRTTTDGAALRNLLDAGRITVLQATPTTFRLLLEAGWTGTKGLTVLVGGEAVPPDLANQLASRAAAVWNMYGPTETTIWSLVHPLAKSAPVLIGRPIANTEVYVLDRNRALVPIGVNGELFIGGDGLADGYLGRPDLTAERFVPDPFSHREGARLYRTGDVVRYRRDGALQFLGRTDFQVKIRGYRIELGEVEARLAEHAHIAEVVVVARDERLLAYFTPRGETPSATDLRTHLRTKLPEYMIPAAFVVLTKLPLTANNKIDRKALPAPAASVAEPSAFDASPREALDFKLRGIWEDVLGRSEIGVRDDFFDLGGHSLLALKLFDRIERAFDTKLPVATIFEAPTVEKMSALLRTSGWKPRWTSLVPIQPGGSKRPFFCVHGGGAHVLFYHPMAKRLGPDQPFYGLQPRAFSVNDINDPTNRSVESMAAHYLAEMREIQPRGPYLIGGASYGGTIALEIAQQLEAVGERAALVAMFDTYGPGYYRAPSGLGLVRGVPVEAWLRLEHHVGSLIDLPADARVPYLKDKVERVLEEGGEAVDEWRREIGRGVLARIGRAIPKDLEVVRNAVNEAVARYEPKPYAGTITLFRARRQAPGTLADPTLGWRRIAKGGVEIHAMPGYHAAMISEPRVAELEVALRACLARAR